MLQNAYFLAKIGADTTENEQHFAEILPITLEFIMDIRHRVAARGRGGRAPASPRSPPGLGHHRAGLRWQRMSAEVQLDPYKFR